MSWISKLLFTPVALYVRHLVLSAPGGAAVLQGVELVLVAETRVQGILTLLSGLGLLSGAIQASRVEKQIAAKKVQVLEETVVAIDQGEAQATDV